MDKYTQRLLDEWKQHGKIIVAVDFDDTISAWSLNTQAECQPIIDLLKRVKATGAYIVVFTACNPDRYTSISDHCKTIGLEIDSINANPISLPYGNNNKIYANIFLDDRAGLQESAQRLETAMYNYRGYQNHQRNKTEIG